MNIRNLCKIKDSAPELELQDWVESHHPNYDADPEVDREMELFNSLRQDPAFSAWYRYHCALLLKCLRA